MIRRERVRTRATVPIECLRMCRSALNELDVLPASAAVIRIRSTGVAPTNGRKLPLRATMEARLMAQLGDTAGAVAVQRRVEALERR